MATRTPLVDLIGTADAVIRDRIENKWSMVGIFNQILCTGFPVIHPKLGIYVRMADVFDDVRLQTQLMDPTGMVIATKSQLIKGQPHRKGNEEMGGYLDHIHLTRAGRYMIQVLHEGTVIGETKLDVVQVPVPEPME